MQAAEKVLLPTCIKDLQNLASILRPAYDLCERLSPQFEFGLCGVAQMSAIQTSIGSLKEGVDTWGHRLKVAQEGDEQDAQELQQARASHSQAVNHVCRLQVSVLTPGITVWHYTHALFNPCFTRHLCAGNLNSETPGDSTNAFVHCADV